MRIRSLAASLTELLCRAVADRVFPGCVTGVVTGSGERHIIPVGRQTYDPTSPAIDEHSVFDVASVTKAIPVSCLALQLIDQGRLRLDDPLIRYVPEFRNSHRSDVRIKHLLTHTLDFGFRLSALKDRSAEEILQTILTTEFASSPGTRFAYANATSILLGLVIERVCGASLPDAAEDVFFGPLRMTNTTFAPSRLPPERVVPTEIDPWRGREIRGEIHDESAWALRSRGAVGSAGLFATVPDLLTFLEMLVRGGEREGRRFLSSEILGLMTANQIPELDACTGLGWELSQPRFMGSSCSPRTIGKTGFTGCSCVCDLERGVGIVLLSNHTYPQRREDRRAIDEVRSRVSEMVWRSGEIGGTNMASG